MRIIRPSFEILDDISPNGIKELQKIERIARVCYKSEDRITEDGESAEKMIKMLIKKGHEAMLEHSQLSVLITTDRGVANELVRHRLCSFAQESTRYCNYGADKFNNEVAFVLPEIFFEQIRKDLGEATEWFMKMLEYSSFTAYSNIYGVHIIDHPNEPKGLLQWIQSMKDAENAYFRIINRGRPPELAREVLPISTKADIVVTTNYREWRHMLKLRTAPDAHPNMRGVMTMIGTELKQKIPIVFDDIELEDGHATGH